MSFRQTNMNSIILKIYIKNISNEVNEILENERLGTASVKLIPHMLLLPFLYVLPIHCIGNFCTWQYNLFAWTHWHIQYSFASSNLIVMHYYCCYYYMINKNRKQVHHCWLLTFLSQKEKLSSRQHHCSLIISSGSVLQ